MLTRRMFFASDCVVCAEIVKLVQDASGIRTAFGAAQRV